MVSKNIRDLTPEERLAFGLDRNVDDALAEMGRQAREDEACSICHASVRPERRDRHLDWHTSMLREVERPRLPEVYGGAHRATDAAHVTAPGEGQ